MQSKQLLSHFSQKGPKLRKKTDKKYCWGYRKVMSPFSIGKISNWCTQDGSQGREFSKRYHKSTYTNPWHMPLGLHILLLKYTCLAKSIVPFFTMANKWKQLNILPWWMGNSYMVHIHNCIICSNCIVKKNET